MITLWVKGCRICVSFLAIAALTVLLCLDNNGIVAATILAAILHETGHILMMSLFGIGLSQIRVTPFGADIEKSCCAERSYWRDALVSIAGPAANLIFAAIFYFFGSTFFVFVEVNLALALFNLLPIEPLDGGQMLYSILCIRFSSGRSAKIVSIVSFLVLAPLAVLGFLLLFQSPWNFSILFVCIYLVFLLVFKNGRYY